MVQRKRQRAQQTSRKSAPVAASAKSRMFGSKTARAKVQYSKHRSKQRSKQRVPTKFVVSGGWRSDDRLFALRSDEAQARRAWRGYPRQVHVGTGNEESSHQALAAVHALTFTCGRPGCGALVDYIAAKQQVALGQSLRSGAGCAGALSSLFERLSPRTVCPQPAPACVAAAARREAPRAETRECATEAAVGSRLRGDQPGGAHCSQSDRRPQKERPR
jgi:hypothetical protein